MDPFISTTQDLGTFNASKYRIHGVPKVASNRTLYSPPNKSVNTNIEQMNQSSLTMGGFYQYWNNSNEAFALHVMLVYVSPILVALGTVSNLLTYCVLKHRLMRQYSVYFYMALYTLANLLSLILTCGVEWIVHVTKSNHIAIQADWICRLWTFITNIFCNAPTWLIVLMVFDRFIYVCIPSKVRNICTVFTAKVLTCCVAVCLVTIDIHALWIYDRDYLSKICSIGVYEHDVFPKIWIFIAATFHTYLPMILVIILDFLIALQAIMRARQNLNSNYSPLQKQLTTTVLSVSITYLVLTLPHVITNIIQVVNPQLHSSYRSYARLYFCVRLFIFFIYLLHSSVSLLYFIIIIIQYLYSAHLARPLSAQSQIC